MGEETTFAETGAAGAGGPQDIALSPVWVIDPLDGTTNFVSSTRLTGARTRLHFLAFRSAWTTGATRRTASKPRTRLFHLPHPTYVDFPPS